jgi:hypothetical protein
MLLPLSPRLLSLRAGGRPRAGGFHPHRVCHDRPWVDIRAFLVRTPEGLAHPATES